MMKTFLPELFNAYLFLQAQMGVIKVIGADIPKRLIFMQEQNEKHLFKL